jgi:hypothetical protein
VKERSKGQRSSVDGQSHLRSQTSVKASQIMRPFTSQARGVHERIIDYLNDVPLVGPQGFGPALMRWSNQIRLIVVLKGSPRLLACKAFLGHRRSLSRTARTGRTWRGSGTGSKQGRSRVVIVRASAAKDRTTVSASLRESDGGEAGLALSGSGSDWQQSSIMTYSVVLKVSRSIISGLLFFRIGLVRSLDDLERFFSTPFYFIPNVEETERDQHRQSKPATLWTVHGSARTSMACRARAARTRVLYCVEALRSIAVLTVTHTAPGVALPFTHNAPPDVHHGPGNRYDTLSLLSR